MVEREDIAQAYSALDGKAQGNITGFGASRAVKKGFQSLGDFLPDERVVAVASALDPPLHAAEQRQLGAAGSLSGIAQTAKSGRLLVLTETDLWEVRASGRLNGSRPEGARLSLDAITDIRGWSGRRGLSPKEHHLTIDYLQGALVETRVHVLATEATLNHFADALVTQTQAFQAQLASQAQQPAQPPRSVADELAKLAALRESGDLTPAEYEAMKQSLLSQHE